MNSLTGRAMLGCTLIGGVVGALYDMIWWVPV